MIQANSNGPPPSSIPEYFAGQHILITGGTGFMGKVLVEKILRCCPDVAKIYLMMRPKRHGSIDQRWQEIMEIPLFGRLKSENPDAFKKVTLVNCDIDQDDLGLSEESVQILVNNVTLIYHAAAMIQFTDNLRAVLVKNTKATFHLLELAKRMEHLQLFVYLSTAYSNMNIPCHQVEERVLPACQDWRVILKLQDREPLAMAALKEKLLCGHPNPYTWSKSLSEQVVDEYKVHFPTIIIRPAAVCPSWKEPLEGWADILSGTTAMSIPVGLGLMRVLYTELDCYVDWIPVDTAINACIVAAWKKYKTWKLVRPRECSGYSYNFSSFVLSSSFVLVFGRAFRICSTRRPNPGVTDVYNCGVFNMVPMRTKDLATYANELVATYPSKNLIWATHYILTTNDALFHILFILLQLIPGAIMDLGLCIARMKPRLLTLTKKVSNVIRIFKKFSSTQLEFPNDKFKELEEYVSEEDKVFSINVDGLTARKMMHSGYTGALKYCFKEDLSEETLKKNKKKLFWLNIADKIVIYTFNGIVIWSLYRFLASFQALKDFGFIFYKGFYGSE